MKQRCLHALFAVLLLAPAAADAAPATLTAACPPAGYDRAGLLEGWSMGWGPECPTEEGWGG